MMRSLHSTGVGLDFQLEKGMMHHFDLNTGDPVNYKLSDEQYHQVMNPFVDLPDGYKAGFDDDFMSKLKTFFSMGDQGCRRTGRSTLLARILLEEAIECGRKLVLIDHFLDPRGGGEPSWQMGKKIQEWVRWYEERDVFISVLIDDRSRTNPTFEARLMHEPDRYNELRIKGHYINMAAGNPFPVDALKARKKVLEEQILLIEFDD